MANNLHVVDVPLHFRQNYYYKTLEELVPISGRGFHRERYGFPAINFLDSDKILFIIWSIQ